MAHFFQILIFSGMILLTACSREPPTHQPVSEVTVYRGSCVILNCSLDISKLQQYSLYWNKTGHVIKLLHFVKNKEHAVQENHNGLSLVIDKATIDDNGLYKCIITTSIPPPTKTLIAPPTHLTVQAAPQMSIISVDNDKDEVTVVCTLKEFYPEHVNVSLNTTCGRVLQLGNDSRPVRNTDGTFDATYNYLVNISSCSVNTTVTCAADHQTGGMTRSAFLLSGMPPIIPGTGALKFLMWYIIGGALLAALLPFIFYAIAKSHCLRNRVFYSSRQQNISSTEASTELELASKEKSEDENNDILYLMPNFKNTTTTSTRQTKMNECETEYIVLRQVIPPHHGVHG